MNRSGGCAALITGNVLRIERASVHDGRGLRTVLFLKGCNLRCPWCSTPESRSPDQQRGYITELCTVCGKCVDCCPEKALCITTGKDRIIIDRDHCRLCFNCQAACPGMAIRKYGYHLTVEEAVKQICKDEIFYFHSGGGLTVSGGEPFAQAKFTAALLSECKKLGIHTAVESSLHAPYSAIKASLPWLDQLFVDLKQMDSTLHQFMLGKSNRRILENIRKVDASGFPFELIFRLPLIPGFNDSDQNLRAIIDFCAGITNLKEIEVLPYHRLGSATYRHLGWEYLCRDLAPPGEEHLTDRVNFLQERIGAVAVKTGSGFNAG